MKLLFGSFFVLIFNSLVCQELINLPFELEIDSKRDVVTVNKSVIYMDDEVVSEGTQTNNYRLEILDTAFRTTISYQKQLSEEMKNVDSESIPKDQVIESFIYIAEEKLKCLNYHILVDNSSREPIEFINDSLYDKNIQPITKEILSQFSSLMDDDETERERFAEKTIEYLKMSKKNILESVRLELANILSPYTYQFPSEGSIENEVVIDDIPMFSEVPNNEINAVIKIQSELEGDDITVNSELTYDKERFLKVAKTANPAFNDVKNDELDVIERNSFTANLPSSWLTKYESERIISIPGIKVINVSNMKFY